MGSLLTQVTQQTSRWCQSSKYLEFFELIMFDSANVHRLVHIDLKGAPPKISYFEKLIPLLVSHGATGLLLEYEDTFPFHGKVSHLRTKNAYTPADIMKLHSLANDYNIIIIPLIQTFGHFEFVLKHDEQRMLREVDLYPNALCPTHPDSFSLVATLIEQMMELHQNDSYLHIGADEVWHLGRCPRCQDFIDSQKMSTSDLFLTWLLKVTRWIKQEYPGLSLIMWDDMIRSIPLEKLKSGRLGDVVEPMIWQYHARKFDLPEGMFERYAAVFNGLWIASAFKGATGSTQFLPPIQHHINNHMMWLATIAEHKHQFKKLKGITFTGWQRYDHYAVLCELLPVSIPSLCLCMRVIMEESFTEADHQYVSQKLGFSSLINVSPFPRPQMIEQGMNFPGHKIYIGVQMWSNFVCKYHAISNSEGMLGWFSDYMRARNFTNPVQVESIMNPINDLQQNLLELRNHMTSWMLEVYFEDTVEEWLGCFIDPLLDKLKNILEDCKKQILIGGRVRDYKKIDF